MKDLLQRLSLKKDVQDKYSSDMDAMYFSSSQLNHVAKSNEGQPAAPLTLDESRANVNSSERELDETQGVSKDLLGRRRDKQHSPLAQVVDKAWTDSNFRKNSILSDEEKRISKSLKNIKAGNADSLQLSIKSEFWNYYEDWPDEGEEFDEDQIELESIASKVIPLAAPFHTPVTLITEESDGRRDERSPLSVVTSEHMSFSSPFRPTPSLGTDSLDFGEATPLKTTRSWYIAVNAPSRSPPEAQPLAEGRWRELTDSSLGIAAEKIMEESDYDRFDEAQETGRARRTNNPIFQQSECEDLQDPLEREASIGATFAKKETERKKKRVQSQPARRFLESLRSIRRVRTFRDTTQWSKSKISGIQRNQSVALPRRNVPFKSALKRVTQSQRYIDRNVLTRIRKAPKPPPLPSVENFTLAKLEWHKSTPSLLNRNPGWVIASSPGRQTSAPLPGCETPKSTPVSSFVPPPCPVKDMRLPPLPNKPKSLIPKLYKDENEAVGYEIRADSPSSQAAQQSNNPTSKNYCEPPMLQESLKPKYYDPNGRPVNMFIPTSVW